MKIRTGLEEALTQMIIIPQTRLPLTIIGTTPKLIGKIHIWNFSDNVLDLIGESKGFISINPWTILYKDTNLKDNTYFHPNTYFSM